MFSHFLPSLGKRFALETAISAGKAFGPDATDIGKDVAYTAVRAAKMGAMFALAPFGLRPHHKLAKQLMGHTRLEQVLRRNSRAYGGGGYGYRPVKVSVRNRVAFKKRTYKSRYFYKKRSFRKRSKWSKGGTLRGGFRRRRNRYTRG